MKYKIRRFWVFRMGLKRFPKNVFFYYIKGGRSEFFGSDVVLNEIDNGLLRSVVSTAIKLPRIRIPNSLYSLLLVNSHVY